VETAHRAEIMGHVDGADRRRRCGASSVARLGAAQYRYVSASSYISAYSQQAQPASAAQTRDDQVNHQAGEPVGQQEQARLPPPSPGDALADAVAEQGASHCHNGGRSP